MLFESKINLRMTGADVIYYPNFFNKYESDFYFNKLLKNIKWQQDTITVFGKTHLQPRLTAFYADNNKTYKYSNIVMQPQTFEGNLLKNKKILEADYPRGKP
tara:strand:- start:1221 stop:1526 length:306 start_codon:yes stop_codon:yes gene_type:complete